MNTRTLLAATVAALLLPLAASAQDDPRLQEDSPPVADQAAQETMTDTVSDDLPWGEPDLPPPVHPDPAPVDPRVPTAEQLDDPMSTPPEPDVPPPDVDPVPMESNERWRQLDADGDGRISAEEGRVDADFHSGFEMMDTNSDGFIDRTELDTAPTADATDDGDATHADDAIDDDDDR